MAAQAAVHTPGTTARHTANALLQLLERLQRAFGFDFNMFVALPLLLARIGVAADDYRALVADAGRFVEDDLMLWDVFGGDSGTAATAGSSRGATAAAAATRTTNSNADDVASPAVGSDRSGGADLGSRFGGNGASSNNHSNEDTDPNSTKNGNGDGNNSRDARVPRRRPEPPPLGALSRATLLHVVVRYALERVSCPPCDSVVLSSLTPRSGDTRTAQDMSRCVDASWAALLQAPPPPRRARAKRHREAADFYGLLEAVFVGTLRGEAPWHGAADFAEVSRQLTKKCRRQAVPATASGGAAVFVHLMRTALAQSTAAAAAAGARAARAAVGRQVRLLSLWALHTVCYGDAPLGQQHQSPPQPAQPVHGAGGAAAAAAAGAGGGSGGQRHDARACANPRVAALGVLTFLGVVSCVDEDGNSVYPAPVRALCAAYLLRVDFR